MKNTINVRRAPATLIALFITAAVGLGGLTAITVSSAPAHAGVIYGDDIAKLARENEGKKWCSTTSLGDKFYGKKEKCPSSEWCSRFVKWVWKKNGVNVAGIGGSAASVESAAKENGSTVHTSKTYKPRLGDVVTFSSYKLVKTKVETATGTKTITTKKIRYRWAHVAVVSKVNDDGSIKYTNGNWGGKSKWTSIVKTKNLSKKLVSVGSDIPSLKFRVKSYTTPGGVSYRPKSEVSIVSAASSPSSGTTATNFVFSVVTNVPATKLKFNFDDKAADYWVSESGMLPTWGATTRALVQGQTIWTISDHKLAAGTRTITVTGYDAKGSPSAPMTFRVAVKGPIVIMSATPSKTTGRSTELFGYTVVTDVAASKLDFKFNGVSKTYTVSGSGALPEWGAQTTATVSADRKTWQITKDEVKVGDRTITVTAYDTAGAASAPVSFKILIVPPITIVSASPDKTSGKASELFAYTVITDFAASKLKFKFNGTSGTFTVSGSGDLPSWGAKTTATVSDDRKLWKVKKDDLHAGKRTITITAYDMDGNASDPVSFQINVT